MNRKSISICLIGCVSLLCSLMAAGQDWAPVAAPVKKVEIPADGDFKKLPFWNPELPMEVRIWDLIDRMTLEEKIAWTKSWHEGIPRLGVPGFGFQGEALHGLGSRNATMFPQCIGMAAMFDEELLLKIGDAVSSEGRAHGKLSVWAPNLNLSRDPRWGRNQETYGEDPFLVSRMGVNYIKGLQGDDPDYYKLLSCAKHFVVHNGPESGKTHANVRTPELDFIETYLPAFKAAVEEADVQGIMGAYNVWNWETCVASRYMLTGLIRDSWGFDGYVVTDCGALQAVATTQKRVSTPEEAVALAVSSGVNLNCGDCFTTHIPTAVEKGLLTEEDLDSTIYTSIQQRMKLGDLDPKGSTPYDSISRDVLQCRAHQDLSLEATRKSLVLLQNKNNLLPFPKELKSIAVIGPNARTAQGLTGNYAGRPDHIESIYEGLEKKVGDHTRLKFVKGCSLADEEYFETIPKEVLRTPDGKPGLKAEYFSKPDLQGEMVGSEIVPALDLAFEWMTFDDAQPWDKNSSLFTGFLIPRKTGEHVIALESFQGFRLAIDGEQIIFRDMDRNGNWQAPEKIETEIHLKAGRKYRVEVSMTKTQGKNEIFLEWREPDSVPIRDAVNLAKQADAVIFVGGIGCMFEDEQQDRDSVTLPERQRELLAALVKTRKPIVLVLINGGMLAIPEEARHIPAILEAWYPGQFGGTAVADVLFGDVNPSGKLPITFYTSDAELPAFNDYSMENRTYRYYKGKPLYRFGHGLSYTTFEYSNLHLPDTVAVGESLKVQVDVQNTGERDGDEVVQLYIHLEGRNAPRVPISALKAFERIPLQAGEKKTITLTVKPELFSHVDRAYREVITSGDVLVMVGGCSPDTKNGKAVPGNGLVAGRISLAGDALFIP